RIAADRDALVVCPDLRVKIAEHRVVLEQMSERGGVGQVVDRNEVDLPIAKRGAHDVAADSPEAVDAYPDCHVRLPSWPLVAQPKHSILSRRVERGQSPRYTSVTLRAAFPTS